MSGKQDGFGAEDQELEQMLREALAVSMDAAEPSPRVMAEVMRQVKVRPRGETSPANILAVVAAVMMGVAFMAIRAWVGFIPGFSYLSAGQVHRWGLDVLSYALNSFGSALETMLRLGLGERFPILLAAVISLGLLALAWPGRSGSRV